MEPLSDRLFMTLRTHDLFTVLYRVQTCFKLKCYINNLVIRHFEDFLMEMSSQQSQQIVNKFYILILINEI